MMQKVYFIFLGDTFDDRFISLYPYPATIVLGARAWLICRTVTTTLPDFIRVNRGEEVLLNKRKSELTVDYPNGKVRGWVEFEIEEAKLEDSGNYTCEARWYPDMRTAEYRMKVFGKSILLLTLFVKGEYQLTNNREIKQRVKYVFASKLPHIKLCDKFLYVVGNRLWNPLPSDIHAFKRNIKPCL